MSEHTSWVHVRLGTCRFRRPQESSALLDLVALRDAEALVRLRREGLADVRGVLGVARAHAPLPGHARRWEPLASGHLAAAPKEEDGHLHTRAADLDLRLVWVA